MEDADVDATVARTPTAKFRNAGQVCTSPTRFPVTRPLLEAFSQRFAAAAPALVVGNGDPATQVGRLTSDRRRGWRPDGSPGRGRSRPSGWGPSPLRISFRCWCSGRWPVR
jgi:hypothetical protein